MASTLQRYCSSWFWVRKRNTLAVTKPEHDSIFHVWLSAFTFPQSVPYCRVTGIPCALATNFSTLMVSATLGSWTQVPDPLLVITNDLFLVHTLHLPRPSLYLPSQGHEILDRLPSCTCSSNRGCFYIRHLFTDDGSLCYQYMGYWSCWWFKNLFFRSSLSTLTNFRFSFPPTPGRYQLDPCLLQPSLDMLLRIWTGDGLCGSF